MDLGQAQRFTIVPAEDCPTTFGPQVKGQVVQGLGHAHLPLYP
jgi:hypothetical protein